MRVRFPAPMFRVARAVFLAILAVAMLAAGGCTASMTPGKMSSVQPTSDLPRAGNVYLLRGWLGIFSYGIDGLTVKLNEAGIRAHQYQDTQWPELAETLKAKYANQPGAEPLILIGHSYGADDVIRLARELKKANIDIDLLVTLDPVTPPLLPSNVKLAYNLYQTNGWHDALPWLRGVPMNVAPETAPEQLVNVDIRRERPDLVDDKLDHFTIEKEPQIHAEVIEHVLQKCPPREQWARAHGLPPFGSRPALQATASGRPTVAPGAAASRQAAAPATRPSQSSAGYSSISGD